MISQPQSPASVPLHPEQARALANARRSARWVGVYLPLALTALAAVVLVLWLPRMPDPIATHWGASGEPDGFGSPLTNLWVSLAIGIGMTAVFGLIPFFASQQSGAPVWGPVFRLLAATNLACVVLIQATTLFTAYVQLDLADARQATPIGTAMLVIGVGAVLVGALGWLVQPKLEIRRNVDIPAEPLPLTPTERAVWFGTVQPSKTFLWVMAGAILVMIFSVWLMYSSAADPVASLIAVGSLLLVIAVGAMSCSFRVRIDSNGIEARSMIGWPRFRVPSADVKTVEATEISPFAEFGGWGIRWAPGRLGLVMRTGEGVVITRNDGRIFALTIDDSKTAAAALAAAKATA